MTMPSPACPTCLSNDMVTVDGEVAKCDRCHLLFGAVDRQPIGPVPEEPVDHTLPTPPGDGDGPPAPVHGLDDDPGPDFTGLRES